MKVGLIDYGAGNLSSVQNALRFLKHEPVLIASGEELVGVDKLIFPGVGSFGDSMEQLQERRLVDPIKKWIDDDRPFFGICIGYQLLFEGSEESEGVDGLGIFAGKVTRFPSKDDGEGLKVPQMGWNEAKFYNEADPMWAGLGGSCHFYFVHSYYPVPEDSSIHATSTEYGVEFTSAIRRGNLLATQFHPEKSQEAGLKLIGNFLEG